MMDAIRTRNSDTETLLARNADYVRSVQASDVARFEQILAPDFYCSNPDGSLVDRAEFLRQIRRPAAISGLQATNVLVRVFGDFAIVHARTTYLEADGRAGSGRYTDVWARMDGCWLALSAHVTR